MNASMNYGTRNDLIVATAASGNSSWIDSFPSSTVTPSVRSAHKSSI